MLEIDPYYYNILIAENGSDTEHEVNINGGEILLL